MTSSLQYISSGPQLYLLLYARPGPFLVITSDVCLHFYNISDREVCTLESRNQGSSGENTCNENLHKFRYWII